MMRIDCPVRYNLPMRDLLSVLVLLISAMGLCPAWAQEQPDEDPALALLDRVAQRAQSIQSLQAKLRYDRHDLLLGDEQRRFGTLHYLAGPPAQYAVLFDRLIVDGNRSLAQDKAFLYDGAWLVERDGESRMFTKRQLVDPNDPHRGDPLLDGTGPFPLPLTLNAQRVRQRFIVTLPEPTPDDPAHADVLRLRLTPRSGDSGEPGEPGGGPGGGPGEGPGGGPGGELQTLDLWYDAQTLLPIRARVSDAAGEREEVYHLSLVQENAPMDRSVFDTRVPAEAGWHVEVSPWQGGVTGAGGR